MLILGEKLKLEIKEEINSLWSRGWQNSQKSGGKAKATLAAWPWGSHRWALTGLKDGAPFRSNASQNRWRREAEGEWGKPRHTTALPSSCFRNDNFTDGHLFLSRSPSLSSVEPQLHWSITKVDPWLPTWSSCFILQVCFKRRMLTLAIVTPGETTKRQIYFRQIRWAPSSFCRLSVCLNLFAQSCAYPFVPTNLPSSGALNMGSSSFIQQAPSTF